MFADYVWLFAIAGGAALLGLAIAVGMARQRPLTRKEKTAQSEKIDELYKR